MVWVRPRNEPANMIVAPNSPSARAQHRIAPPNSAGAARGTVTWRKTCHSLAPSTRAASLLPFPTFCTMPATVAGAGGRSITGGNGASTGSFGTNLPSFHAAV